MASTLLQETFPEGARTTQNLPTTSAWYTSRPDTNITYSAGSLGLNTAGASGFVITYFTDSSPVSLAIGQSLSVTFTFQVLNATNTSGGLRIGLFNSAGSRVAADGLGAGSSGTTGSNETYLNYTGYTAYVNPSSTSGSPMSFRQRNSGVDGQLITSNNAYSSIVGSTGGTANTLANGITYTGVYTLTRTADDIMSLSLSITGGSLSGFEILRQDTSGISTSFDTFALSSSSAMDSFTLNSVTVTVTPEPETLALLIGAGAALFAFMRRKSLAVIRFAP